MNVHIFLCILCLMYMYMCVTSFSPSLPPSSQLHMFLQLMQQAPEVLQALGMSADSLKQEIIKMEEADKLKVLVNCRVSEILGEAYATKIE